MQMKAKQEIKGKPVVIFDTMGMQMEEIVEQLVNDGWQFRKLTVEYPNKSGGISKQDVGVDKIDSVQAKYHFQTWTFSAVRGEQKVAGKLSAERNALAIILAQKGALKAVAALEPEEDYYDDMFAEESQVAAGAAAAASLYEEDTTVEPALSPQERQKQRDISRQEEQQAIQGKKIGKHTHLIIFSIIEILLLIPIGFGISALRDTLKGRKMIDIDPTEAKKRFKEAKCLLIVGCVFELVFLGVLWLKFGNVAMSLLGFK